MEARNRACSGVTRTTLVEEFDANMVGNGALKQVSEVRPDGRLSVADVDAEDLHALQLVDNRAIARSVVSLCRSRRPLLDGPGRTPKSQA